jgi:L-seryl-tRNA(Ser) seleniumtransferase
VTDLRSLIPSVDALVGSTEFAELLGRYPRTRVVDAARAAVAEVRGRIGSAESPESPEAPSVYATLAEAWLEASEVASLRRVINATGVVLHTNLGRAPLADTAVEAMVAAAREYTNLEYDLDAGARGSRYVHCVSLLTELTGAEDALVVNNAAAALVLALTTLAPGAGVVVSRGELVEIGGGFRIPEILERSGARLVEVGSTNRTRLGDYRKALEAGGARVLLKVHRSNFRITGFTEEASLEELAGLAREHDVALLHDLGSGLLMEPERLGLPGEPRPHDSLRAGTDLVAFSGDKLLGGPQAGVLLGRADLIARLRSDPMCRALRVDKGTLAGLEATLRLYRDPDRALSEIPTLRMLHADSGELEARARAVASTLETSGVECGVVETAGAVGGGTFPDVELPSWGVRLGEGMTDELARALRAGDPPVVGRVLDDAVVLDVRTVLEGQESELAERVVEAAASSAGRGSGDGGGEV